MKLRAATRASELARWQTRHVAGLLEAVAPHCEVVDVVTSTEGDRRTDVPISALAGRGVFVKEVQSAVLEGRADVAVHSAKDLMSEPTPGLVLAALPARGDPRDALVGGRLDELARGAVVATGSVRRRAQLASMRPDLSFVELRGNIDTRLARVESGEVVVMAAAALERLGRFPAVVDVLSTTTMVPQVGQGALAVECRADDDATRALLAEIDDRDTRAAVEAERAFLAEIGSGCDLPVGAHATVDGERVSIGGLLATLDGRVVLRATSVGIDPVAVGRDLARSLLDDHGGGALLTEAFR